MFDDIYIDLVKKVVERYKKYIDKYLFEFVKYFVELFSDKYKVWVDRVKSNIEVKIYRDLIFGLDIDLYLIKV